MHWFTRLSNNKFAWAFVSLSAWALVFAALYFQHVQDYLPCVKCIYQRTAVIGVAISATLPLLLNRLPIRLISIVLWGYASYMGFVVASDQIEVINYEGFFAPPCPIEPNFPQWLALHEWLPSIFAGPGDCADDSWQFAGYGMAEWMRIIFVAYMAGVVIAAVSTIASLFNRGPLAAK